MIELRRFLFPFGVLFALVIAGTLNGCATTARQLPPAPIVDARRPPPPAPVAVDKPASQPDPEPARVYAYQPPTTESPSAPATTDTAGAGETDAASRAGEPPLAGASTGQSQPPAEQPSSAQPPSSAPAPSEAVRAESGPSIPALPAPETRVASADAPGTPQLTPAVDALVKQAERQRQSSDYAGAAATLERALRLQSREGYLWNRLAHVRLEQGLATQAANLAARANDLSGDSESLKRDNWRVIADARRRAGDLQGAQEAQRKADGG